MYIRCTSCNATTRVPIDSAQPRVTCVACGRTYDLTRASEIGGSPEERYRRAQAFATEKGTDLASAYSVLLGLMPEERAVGLDGGPDDGGPQEDRHRAGSGSRADEHGLPYDQGFLDAVAAGHLTIRMAIERGDRVAFASRVARQHGLPMSIAFDVADNRISVGQAVALKAARKPTGEDKAKRPSGILAFASLLVACGVVLALLALWFRGGGEADALALRADSVPTQSKPALAAPSVEPITLIRADAAGRLTQIIGPSPRWVLNVFCTSNAGATARRPVRTDPLEGGGWLGVFDEAGATHAIVIRKHDLSDAWTVGNGTEPIRPEQTSP